jgi:hypothetical protein
VFHRLIGKVGDLNVATTQDHKGGLEVFLERFADRAATGPRDKIYALLGLCKWTRVDPVKLSYPDFTSIEDLLITTTFQFIRESNLARVLEGHSEAANILTLPSWVPDWSMTNGLPATDEFSTYRDITLQCRW